MSIASLTTKIKNVLNGAKGIPSPLGTLAATFKLGDLLQSLIDQANTPTVDSIAEATSGAGVTIDGVLLKDSQVTTDQINEKTSAAGVTIDGCLVKDGRVAGLATASIFLSTEQTGTGSAQNVAHGFGAVPAVAIATFSELDGNAADVAYGTHTTTNVVVTVTAGQKFHVLALK